MIGPGLDIDQLGHPGADQLVEPFGDVALGLGLVGEALRDGVTGGGVIGCRAMGVSGVSVPRTERNASTKAKGGSGFRTSCRVSGSPEAFGCL